MTDASKLAFEASFCFDVGHFDCRFVNDIRNDEHHCSSK